MYSHLLYATDAGEGVKVMQAERLRIVERFDRWDDEINIGPLRLFRLAQPPTAALGTPCHGGAADPDQYHLVLPLQGAVKLGNSTRSRVFTPGDMFLVDTPCPPVFDAGVPRTHQPPDVVPSPLVALRLQIPKELVPLPTDLMDSLMATPLRQHNVFGLTLSRLLVDLLCHPVSFSAAQGHRLSGVLLELLAGMLGSQTSEDAMSEGTYDDLFIRVQDFIQQHLGDPELTPAQVAAEHHISRRHLQRLFQQRGITVAASIRQQRLERACCDLIAPHLATYPISAIAARWGFRHAADFSRAFRKAYGVAPSDFRLARTGRRCAP
ncbi:helix-turn-helix domain-containing protein [Streptomyces roseirectus]|uniref:Helix-turn-helix domain-containing protein n=1 Tax=Streptomyces roseirectus TaxID=2768066 RepID=A0A7H0IA20_9ACTN|nr:helix-turn-helix domain-containing protein [Streptomyces roseirectus]QNP69636.1 helix-turn-helix domain-containing protein [Streptomyces roseirectus]